jgi:DNA polymerase-1
VREDLIPEVMIVLDEKMSSAAQLDVPLIVESGVGKNWEVAH